VNIPLSVPVLSSLPVLIVGAGLCLGLRSNRAAGTVTVISQLVTTLLAIGGSRASSKGALPWQLKERRLPASSN
jgi:hypothetical protein